MGPKFKGAYFEGRRWVLVKETYQESRRAEHLIKRTPKAEGWSVQAKQEEVVMSGIFCALKG